MKSQNSQSKMKGILKNWRNKYLNKVGTMFSSKPKSKDKLAP